MSELPRIQGKRGARELLVMKLLKLMSVRWVEHVARTKMIPCVVMVRKPARKISLTNQDEDGRIVLTQMLNKLKGKTLTGLIWLMIATSGRLL